MADLPQVNLIDCVHRHKLILQRNKYTECGRSATPSKLLTKFGNFLKNPQPLYPVLENFILGSTKKPHKLKNRNTKLHKTLLYLPYL